MTASSTTPTPLGKNADPRFTVGFDLTVTMRVAVVGGKLEVSNVVPEVSNAAITSRNFSADVILAVNDVGLFVGINVRRVLEMGLNRAGDVAAFRNVVDQQVKSQINTRLTGLGAVPPDTNLTYDPVTGRLLLVV